MSGPIVGVIGIFVMFAVLFVLRMPAAFTMMIVGFLGVSYVTSFKAALGMIGPDLWNIFSNYGLTVIPMFILVGEFVHYGGYNNSLYYATHKWFGHYRGGLAITTIMACAAFSAISGSNTATAATMSSVAIPGNEEVQLSPHAQCRFRCSRRHSGCPNPSKHCSGGLRALHGTIHRQALFWKCHSQCYSHGPHSSNRPVYLLSPSGMGSKRSEEHVERKNEGPSGDHRYSDSLCHYHVRPVHGCCYGH